MEEEIVVDQNDPALEDRINDSIEEGRREVHMWDQVLNENGLDAHKQRADSIV